MGELGLNGAMLPWFLLVTFLHLPFAIWLSLVLVVPAVSGWCLSLLCVCKSVSAPLVTGFLLTQHAVALPRPWMQVGLC